MRTKSYNSSTGFTPMNSAGTPESSPAQPRYNPRPSRYSSSVANNSTDTAAAAIAAALATPNSTTTPAAAAATAADQSTLSYTCEDCHASFSTYPEFRNHIQSDACGSGSASGGGFRTLNSMTRSAGLRADRWLCDICGKDYSSKGNLQRHQENLHGAVEDVDRDRDEREESPASTATGISVHQLPQPDHNIEQPAARRGRKRKRLNDSENIDRNSIESEEDDDGDDSRRNRREDSCVLHTPPPPDVGMSQNGNSNGGEKMIVNGNQYLGDIATASLAGDNNVSSIDGIQDSGEQDYNNHDNGNGSSNYEDNGDNHHNHNDNDNDSVTDMILNQIPSHPYPPTTQQYTPTSPSFSPNTGSATSSQISQLTRENRTLKYKLDQALKELAIMRAERKKYTADNARLRRNNGNLLQMVNDYAKMEEGY